MKTSAQIKIELLQDAKKRLKKTDKTNTYRGLCECVEESAYTQERGWGRRSLASDQLTFYFSKQLGNYAWLSGWLSHHRSKYPSNAALRKARLQWIDWLIASLEEHGDEQMRKAARRGKK